LNLALEIRDVPADIAIGAPGLVSLVRKDQQKDQSNHSQEAGACKERPLIFAWTGGKIKS
jgi:hypothetical protein